VILYCGFAKVTTFGKSNWKLKERIYNKNVFYVCKEFSAECIEGLKE
jgi:hypothetical protein